MWETILIPACFELFAKNGKAIRLRSNSFNFRPRIPNSSVASLTNFLQTHSHILLFKTLKDEIDDA